MLSVSDEVAEALAAGQAVVALESALIAHGLPTPENLTTGRELEAIVREQGAVPATVGVIDGVARVGLSDDELARVAEGGAVKASVRDLPLAVSRSAAAATTVAGTIHLAHLVGIRVAATGGLGGVHRGASSTFDESADLSALATTPVTVVCAGVKSVLDVGATMERLETLGVPVVGYHTRTLPGFYVADAGVGLDWSVEEPREVAEVMAARDALGLAGRGLVVAQPLEDGRQLDPVVHDDALTRGLSRLVEEGVSGKAVTPFLLDHLREATEGATLRVNIEVVRANTRLAARIAVAWADHRRQRQGL